MQGVVKQMMNDRILVAPLDAEEKTPGGIIVPEKAKGRPVKGRIVAVGPGKRNEAGDRIPVALEEGQVVLFGKFSGTEFELNGEDYSIMREDEILAVLEDDTPDE